MSYYAQRGTLANGSVTLTNGSLSQTIFTSAADEYAYVYSILITTNDTASETVTVSDGTTSVLYAVGGSSNNSPVIDQSSIPLRFKKGAAITVTASSVTSGKSTYVNIRHLANKT